MSEKHTTAAAAGGVGKSKNKNRTKNKNKTWRHERLKSLPPDRSEFERSVSLVQVGANADTAKGSEKKKQKKKQTQKQQQKPLRHHAEDRDFHGSTRQHLGTTYQYTNSHSNTRMAFREASNNSSKKNKKRKSPTCPTEFLGISASDLVDMVFDPSNRCTGVKRRLSALDSRDAAASPASANKKRRVNKKKSSASPKPLSSSSSGGGSSSSSKLVHVDVSSNGKRHVRFVDCGTSLLSLHVSTILASLHARTHAQSSFCNSNTFFV